MQYSELGHWLKKSAQWVDAAWAGSAMICPEFRQYWQGVDGADSIVFNPHKWLGAQFDCSVQFLANPTSQINTLGLRPSYLQTLDAEEVTNFNEWTVPLGRRFRALKLCLGATSWLISLA